MGEGQAGPQRSVGYIGHQVAAERRYPGDAGVFGSRVVAAPFPSFVRCQDNALAFDAGRDAVVADDHLGEPHAGDIAFRHEARQEV
jgi:hypothetical protein